MTAQVAVLNKHGVALAADSAITVTINGEKKVHHTGNKLFMLSKYYPVGIMIYSNSAFMNIDWEIIIKQFRQKLKANSYPTLLEYVNEFFKFTQNFSYINNESQKDLLNSLCHTTFSKIRNTFISNLEDKFNEQKNITSSQITQVFNSTIKKIQHFQKSKHNTKNFVLDKKYILSHKKFIREDT